MKRINLSIISLFLYSTQGFAADKPNVFIDGPLRVCWYQGQQYSEGALIKQFDWIFQCTNRLENEQNGQLMWIKIDNEGNRIEPPVRSNIRIHN